MKIGVIIQARMGSTRLPGKILMKLDETDTVLDIQIKRLKYSKLTDEIILATTVDNKNDILKGYALKHDIMFFRGSEENVLERYYFAAKENNIDIIVRITSDCPFVDPAVLDEMLDFYIKNNYDYVSNLSGETNFSRGFECEIFSFHVLEKVFKLAKTIPEKEHVTYFIYTHREMFTIFYYNLANLKNYDDLRLTIDEEDDFEICREIYKRLMKKNKKINFSVYDIYEIIEENPELMNLNKHVKQKEV